MWLRELVETSEAVRATRSRNAKTERLAAVLRALEAAERRPVTDYLRGALPQGRIGVGPAAVRQAAACPAAGAATLRVADVAECLESISRLSGGGSARARREALQGLFGRASAPEQSFLARLLMGDLRQGASDGLMVEAVARAAGLEADAVRRAWMVGGDLAAVAEGALGRGAAGLADFRLRLFQPVRPMLAQPARDLEQALERLGEAALEFKLDGARIQLHKSGDEVRVFTRRLHDVTAALPEIVHGARGLAVRDAILDGEVLALRANGRPHPFQTTMRRFGRRRGVQELVRQLPVEGFFFDCLLIDGEELLQRPLRDRALALAQVVPEHARMPRLVTGSGERAESFWQQALARGHEGLMAKSLDSTYDAGGRGAEWLKLKPAHTLDLIVLAAEWGSGRRRGWLSNLHLGARDPASGQLVMLGKTFKGLTDAMLEWQTKHLLSLETEREAHTVHVRPELVVEVAFNVVQASPHYPGGLALRFARVKAHRPDKRVADADTLDRVQAIFAAA